MRMTERRPRGSQRPRISSDRNSWTRAEARTPRRTNGNDCSTMLTKTTVSSFRRPGRMNVASDSLS
jgi:hypothetical protein